MNLKWLALSPETFEKPSDISFSIEKPLFAASVVLNYLKTDGALHATAVLRAKIPIKGRLHYVIETQSEKRLTDDSTFTFSRIEERDEAARNERVSTTDGAKLTIAKISSPTAKNLRGSESVKSYEILNDSPAPLLAPLLVLPALQGSHDSGVALYAGHVSIGSRTQALRLERKASAGGEKNRIETYEGRLISVPHALSEDAWLALPWTSKKAFEFDWDVEKRTVLAARLRIPIIGSLEIRA